MKCSDTPPPEQTIAFNKFVKTCPQKGEIAYALIVYKDGTSEDYVLFNPVADFLPARVQQATDRLVGHIKSEQERKMAANAANN